LIVGRGTRHRKKFLVYLRLELQQTRRISVQWWRCFLHIADSRLANSFYLFVIRWKTVATQQRYIKKGHEFALHITNVMIPEVLGWAMLPNIFTLGKETCMNIKNVSYGAQIVTEIRVSHRLVLQQAWVISAYAVTGLSHIGLRSSRPESYRLVLQQAWVISACAPAGFSNSFSWSLNGRCDTNTFPWVWGGGGGGSNRWLLGLSPNHWWWPNELWNYNVVLNTVILEVASDIWTPATGLSRQSRIASSVYKRCWHEFRQEICSHDIVLWSIRSVGCSLQIQRAAGMYWISRDSLTKHWNSSLREIGQNAFMKTCGLHWNKRFYWLIINLRLRMKV
jgi:hypothetical protein